MGIKDAIRLDLEQGAHLTEAVAAALFQMEVMGLIGGLGLTLMDQADVDLHPTALALRLDIVIDLQGAAGNAAGSGTDQHLLLLGLQGRLSRS